MKINFNRGWHFSIFDSDEKTGIDDIDLQEPSWHEISIPHTSKIEPEIVNNMWQGKCWYYKTFYAEDSFQGQKVFLEFEGVMTVAEVWINGQKSITHKGGYLPFLIDISGLLSYGATNTIIVKADNHDDENIPPGKPLKEIDFCWYGGIYRNVNLIVKDNLHISNPTYAQKIAGGGILVSYLEVEKEHAVIQVQTEIKNDHLSGKSFFVLNTITDLDGNTVYQKKSSVESLDSGESSCIVNVIEMKNPRLWSPAAPYLYNLETAVVSDGKTTDKENHNIGIRRFNVGADGFFINGEKMYLRGTNRHQEYPFIGYALSDNAQYRDAKIIKEAGFDIVRLSHYPQAPAFLDACDKLGILVINAIPGWQFYKDGEFTGLTLRDAREMIRRDRNHPSILLWETSLNETYNIPDEILKELHEIVHEEIPGDQAYSCGWKDKYYDVFIPARQHTDGPEFWNDWNNGKKAIFTAEYGDFEYLFHDYTRSNFEQTKARRRNIAESSRQARADGEKRLLQQAFNFQESHNQNHICKSMIGDANWVFADYNRGCANDQCESGVVDIFRLPKFSYYFYQSQRDAGYPAVNFNAGPMVFIASYWDRDSSNEIKVFSNCDEVELFLDGSSLGKQKPDSNEYSRHLTHPPFTFISPGFKAGELRATAYIGGNKKAEHIVVTPDTAHSIKLNFDIRGRSLAADGVDVIFVHASILDKEGTLVPNAFNEVSFKLEGNGRFIGKNPVSAKAGIATVMLRSGLVPDKIKVKAFSAGLKAVSKIIETKSYRKTEVLLGEQ